MGSSFWDPDVAGGAEPGFVGTQRGPEVTLVEFDGNILDMAEAKGGPEFLPLLTFHT